MKTVTNTLAAIALASTPVAVSAVAAKDLQKLSGPQICARFAGMQFTASDRSLHFLIRN